MVPTYGENMDDNNKYFQEQEEPEFIIERDDESTSRDLVPENKVTPAWKVWLRRLLKAVAVLILVLAAIIAYKWWDYRYNIGLPVSVSPAANIQKLQQPQVKEIPQVAFVSDSILGVKLDIYGIYGLKASIEMEEPSVNDRSVYLYCRSVDHTVKDKYLSTLVVDGKEWEGNRYRLGYMAMVDGQTVIGVSRSEEVKDYVVSQGGSYFRQFALVSNGVIPGNFDLHGKVQRRAIGRLGQRLCFVVSHNKETLWGFADALREYGFTDAIYITGGDNYCYYRTKDGRRHDIGSKHEYSHRKWKGHIPWLVFRKP